MDRFKNKRMDIPLCKFGPGGDYTSELYAEELGTLNQPQEPVSPLGKVLNAIADIIGATVQPERLTDIACALPIEHENVHSHCEEKIQDGQSANQPTSSHHPKTTPGPSAFPHLR